MILIPIPPDGEPTEAEIDAELSARPILADGYIPRALARLILLSRWKEADPDAFLEPFPEDDDEYYGRYLRSGKWRALQRMVIEAANHLCACCGEIATTVHHRDYRPRVLRGIDRTALVPICRRCHHTIHFSHGNQRSWNDCERILADLIANRTQAAVLALAKPTARGLYCT